MSLARWILEQHATAGRTGAVAPSTPLVVRPDLLVADRDTIRMPLGRFVAGGPAKPAVEVLVASDSPGVPGGGAADPGSAEFATLAAECGLVLAPPRAGDRASLALESFAAPGRLLVALGGAPEAGALGTLVVPAGELEALALLCGDPLEVDPAPVCALELTGDLPPRVDGHDLAGALIASSPRAFEGAGVEVSGALEALTIADRVAMTRALVRAGARWVLFPSDDRTREWLRARGREADWRRLDARPPESGALRFDLGWTVPHAIAAARPARAVPVAWWSDVGVAAVEVGPGLDLETLARFATLLRGRTVAPGTTLVVRAWAGLDASAPESAGTRDRVLAAGGRWLGEGDLAPRPRRDERLRLLVGSANAGGIEGEDDWYVSLLAAAEAACAGVLTPPHTWSDPRDFAAAPELERAPFALPALAARGADGVRGRARRPGPVSPGLRGPVLGLIDGVLDDATLLPFGPRLAPELADPARLGVHVAPAAARGAGPHSTTTAAGWLLVLGDVRGIESREAGLLALRSLGVRVVLAAGFDARARGRCARAGLLALRTLDARDMESVTLGDELELVGGLDAWVPDRARVVRDLTRAFAMVALPELTETEWRWVTQGGTAC